MDKPTTTYSFRQPAGWAGVVGSEVLAADAANHRDKTLHGGSVPCKVRRRPRECAITETEPRERALMRTEVALCRGVLSVYTTDVVQVLLLRKYKLTRREGDKRATARLVNQDPPPLETISRRNSSLGSETTFRHVPSLTSLRYVIQTCYMCDVKKPVIPRYRFSIPVGISL